MILNVVGFTCLVRIFSAIVVAESSNNRSSIGGIDFPCLPYTSINTKRTNVHKIWWKKFTICTIILAISSISLNLGQIFVLNQISSTIFCWTKFELNSNSTQFSRLINFLLGFKNSQKYCYQLIAECKHFFLLNDWNECSLLQ